MVNAQVIKDVIGKVQANVANGGELFKQIFTVHPDLRKFYDVEDIDPDSIPKSRQMQQKGAGVLSSFKNLANLLDNEHNFHLEVKELVNTYKELGMKPGDVKRFAPGFISFLAEKAEKLNDGQKKEWNAFFDLLENSLKSGGL